MLYEETTGTLLCGDLFTHLGDGPALTQDDIVSAAVEAENVFGFSQPRTQHARDHRTPRRARRPRTLALMHGSSFTGDGAARRSAPRRVVSRSYLLDAA